MALARRYFSFGSNSNNMEHHCNRVLGFFLFIIGFFGSVFATSAGAKTDSIPIFPDLVYEYRITELDNQTPVELEYNEYVRRYIDVYTIEKREHLANIAGRARRYFPLIEQMLDKHNLPLELKYLAIVESALDPFAVSSSGAVGLWQFKLNTSRMFDLTVNSYIDERRDPYKATEAACDYLQYLYQTYQDWQLALAAYNGGPGVVRKAIERSGGKRSFWKLYPHLPAQTKSYVPAFIAVNYAMNHLKEHQIEPLEPDYQHAETDTLNIHYAASFDKISSEIDLPVEILQKLNPVYRRNFIPNMSQPATLTLPEEKVVTFLQHERQIFKSKPQAPAIDDSVYAKPQDQGKKKLVHVVKRGEYFHKIAMRYNCSIEQIRRWNELPDNNLQVGQKLDIWVEPKYVQRLEQEQKELEKKASADTSKRVVFYTVQKGDTIWKIANKFNCGSIADLIRVNEIQDKNDIQPGKQLKIYLDH